ncbi:MAG: type III secretion system chaperone [bacterium]|nr:type III secretion system chaperone [bacterium]
MDHETTAIARLARAIGYPEEVPAGTRSFVFQVDGHAVESVEEAGRLRLACRFPQVQEEGDLVRLAGYATGRLLKEEAVIAWDPEAEVPMLWQDVPVTTGDALLRRFFEVFMMSCDWWRARVEDAAVVSHMPEMVILP